VNFGNKIQHKKVNNFGARNECTELHIKYRKNKKTINGMIGRKDGMGTSWGQFRTQFACWWRP
jgi:hypothetical protein